jgi:LysR family transcriptional regulator, regulator for bpeEF and oprC
MDRLHGVLVFLSVVETRSFSESARALGVSTSAVSAAVLRLEGKLSVRLLNRTTRRVSPTPEGLEFYQRCKQIIADLEQAETTVGRYGRLPSGRLRIGMPSALGRMWVIPSLPTFIQAFPSVSVEVVIGDFLTATDREGLDAAIQVGELPPSRLLVRKLATADYLVCGSPRYLATRGHPKNTADLKDHSCLSYRRPRNGQIRQWRFARGTTVTPDGTMTFNSGEALIAAAVAGLGLVQVAEYYARPDLDSGRLVEILPELKTHAYDISIVFQQRKSIAPRLRVLIDFLIELFAPPPWSRDSSANSRIRH